jgi:hypothetical protein
MCIIAAKYFDDVGWVGAKNRDRNYVPKISFEREDAGNTEILMYDDDMTGYREGLNSKGIAILSASLKVADDEKEIEKSSNRHSGDGDRINKALKETSVAKALKSCLDSKLTGNTLVFDKDRCFLIEACTRPCEEGEGDGTYEYKVSEIKKDQTVARTNHGINLKWAGYQPNGDAAEKLSRKSSESRLKIARRVIKAARTPQAILNLLCVKYSNNPQMNSVRTATDKKKMRTTAQILLIPSEDTMYFRPIASNINYNFHKLDDPEAKTWVELLSNRPLWDNHDKKANGTMKLKHDI